METNYLNSELSNSEISKLSVGQSNDNTLCNLTNKQDFISSDCQIQFIKHTKERHLNLNELLKNHFTENKTNLKTLSNGIKNYYSAPRETPVSQQRFNQENQPVYRRPFKNVQPMVLEVFNSLPIGA